MFEKLLEENFKGKEKSEKLKNVVNTCFVNPSAFVGDMEREESLKALQCSELSSERRK